MRLWHGEGCAGGHVLFLWGIKTAFAARGGKCEGNMFNRESGFKPYNKSE